MIYRNKYLIGFNFSWWDKLKDGWKKWADKWGGKKKKKKEGE